MVADKEVTALTADEEVSLEVDVRVGQSIEGAPTLYFLRDENLEREIELSEEMAWVAGLMRELQRGSRRVAGLVGVLGVPEEELQETLTYFMRLGLLQRK